MVRLFAGGSVATLESTRSWPSEMPLLPALRLRGSVQLQRVRRHATRGRRNRQAHGFGHEAKEGRARKEFNAPRSRRRQCWLPAPCPASAPPCGRPLAPAPNTQPPAQKTPPGRMGELYSSGTRPPATKKSSWRHAQSTSVKPARSMALSWGKRGRVPT